MDTSPIILGANDTPAPKEPRRRSDPRLCTCGRRYSRPSQVRDCERAGHPGVTVAEAPVEPQPLMPGDPGTVSESPRAAEIDALKTTVGVLAQQLAEAQAQLAAMNRSQF